MLVHECIAWWWFKFPPKLGSSWVTGAKDSDQKKYEHVIK
jgi:hypothetical protein